MQLTVCAEEISGTKTAKKLKVKIEVLYIEKVIQTLTVYLKLLAFHFQDQLFADKTFKVIVPSPAPPNILSEAPNQTKKNPKPQIDQWNKITPVS